MGRSSTTRSSRLAVAALGGLLAVLVSACTATTTDPASAPPIGSAPERLSQPNGSGILPGYQEQTALEFTPLVITVLAAETSPIVVPVEGSDGRFYVAYELSILNSAARDATLTRVETIAGDEHGESIATTDQAHLAANTMLLAGVPQQSTRIPAGRTAIVVFRDAYPTRDAVPGSFTHRVSATFDAPGPDAPRLASKFPDAVAQIGGAVHTTTAPPLVIGPPLAGEGWFANNGLEPAALNAHSDVVIPVGGRVTSAERYAVDFLRIDASTMTSFRGDPTLNTSYLAFDKPLLAVADATVVRVVSDRPDVAPKTLTELAVIDDATGNQVVLDLGDGVYALYAHMKQDSATVRVGDTVTKGQEIGRLGNSGNTSEAHLHFQLQRSPLLSGENVPWVLDEFTSTGALSPDGDSVIAPPKPGKRTGEVPVAGSISAF